MKRKKHSKFLFIILFTIVTALLIYGGAFSIRSRQVVNLENQFRSLEELVTVRQISRNVLYVEKKMNLIGLKRSLFSINYSITAGIDFSQGVSVDGNLRGITISYPSPRILSVDGDDLSINTFFQSERFASFKQSDFLDLIYDEKKRVLEEALIGGILKRADENFRKMAETLLREQGFERLLFIPQEKENHDEI